MDFSEALKAMKMGNKVSRGAWRGRVSSCAIIEEKHTHKTVISKNTPDGNSTVISMLDSDDILADDWWIIV